MVQTNLSQDAHEKTSAPSKTRPIEITPTIPNETTPFKMPSEIEEGDNETTPFEIPPEIEESDNEADMFYEMEMSLDEKFFDGDASEISEGSFVSFKYMGEYVGHGPPLNPKISSSSFVPLAYCRRDKIDARNLL